jgi:secreted PhoX family phosphatase
VRGPCTFRPDGRVIDAFRILDGTRHACSGGGTPWATWLSCDEVEDGLVWELHFGGRRDPVSIGARRLQARGEDAEQLVLQPTRTIESPDVTTL